MKTRIVYPGLWLDVGFAECKPSTKLLFMYLITSDRLGLSRYTRLSDRQILFDTGLNSVQLKESKSELESLRWVFFAKNEWIYHHHNCAYVDYIRNDRVASAKQKEIDNVPDEIVGYFNDICLNKVQTGFEQCSNLNHKPKTINQKEGGMGETKPTEQQMEEIAEKYKVPLSFVLSKWEDVCNWEDEKPGRMKGRNWRLTLMNWVKRDAIKIRQEDYDKRSSKSKLAYGDI